MKNFIEHSKSWLQSNDSKTSISKIKSTIISILLGLIVASITLAAIGHNPFDVFNSIFKAAFANDTVKQKTWAIISLLILSGVANAIAFKTGLFNIGVSGQMFFTGVLTIIIGFQFMNGMGLMGIIVLMLLGMLIGGMIAAISGALKTYFNVHEVVSTILLNWALFFIGKWMLFKVKDLVQNGSETKIINLATSMHDNYTYGYFAMGIAAIVALIFALIFAFTTLGFNLKVTGLSPDASKAAGIKIKRNTIISMLLSGLVAGVLGVVAFVIKDQQVSGEFITGTSLPGVGFNGIAIALLAFNNPLGVIPVAILFGILESGSTFGLTSMGIDRTMADLINGLIIYFAAISVVFQRFQLIKMIYTYFRLVSSPEIKRSRKQYKESISKINEDYNDKLSQGLNKEDVNIQRKAALLNEKKIFKTLKSNKLSEVEFDYRVLTSKHFELSKPEKNKEYLEITSKHNLIESDLKGKLSKEEEKMSTGNLSDRQRSNSMKKIEELKEKIKNNKVNVDKKIHQLIGGE